MNLKKILILSLFIINIRTQNIFQEKTSGDIRFRNMKHFEVFSSSVYGNSTDLMYYYVDIYVGS